MSRTTPWTSSPVAADTQAAVAAQLPNQWSRAPRQHSLAPSATIVGEFEHMARWRLLPAMWPSSRSSTLSAIGGPPTMA